MVTKPSNIKREDVSTLEELLSLSPTLRTLRSFVHDLHQLFALRRSKTQAWKTWRRMRRNQAYLSNEHLLRYLEKVRYKWRRRRTIIRHILLQFDIWIKRKENPIGIAA